MIKSNQMRMKTLRLARLPDWCFNDIRDINVPRLECLSLEDINREDACSLLLKCNQSLKKLILKKINLGCEFEYEYYIFNIMKKHHDHQVFQNIQHLELDDIPGHTAFSLVECSRNSITTLILRNITWFSYRFDNNFRMENLIFLQLANIGRKVFQSLAEINNLKKVSSSNLRRKRVDGIWKRSLVFF